MEEEEEELRSVGAGTRAAPGCCCCCCEEGLEELDLELESRTEKCASAPQNAQLAASLVTSSACGTSWSTPPKGPLVESPSSPATSSVKALFDDDGDDEGEEERGDGSSDFSSFSRRPPPCPPLPSAIAVAKGTRSSKN